MQSAANHLINYHQLRIFILLFFLLTYACNPIPSKIISGKIVKVKDGDSVVLLDEFNQQHEVRLAHIDAPERGQPYGKQSKEFLLELIIQKEVSLRITDDPDRYGREIGEIILADGTIANKEMIKGGYAWHYTKYSEEFEYHKLERNARKSGAGLWEDRNAVAPWEWRDSKKN